MTPFALVPLVYDGFALVPLVYDGFALVPLVDHAFSAPGRSRFFFSAPLSLSRSLFFSSLSRSLFARSSLARSLFFSSLSLSQKKKGKKRKERTKTSLLFLSLPAFLGRVPFVTVEEIHVETVPRDIARSRSKFELLGARRASVFGTLHFSTLHFSTLHFSTLHLSTLHFSTLHFSTLHFSTLHFNALHFSTLHFSTLHLSTLHFSKHRTYRPFKREKLLQSLSDFDVSPRKGRLSRSKRRGVQLKGGVVGPSARQN